MGGHEARGYWDDAGLMMLMGGLLIGPAAWFLDLQISYALVKWACATGHRAVLLAVPAASFAAICLAGWMSWTSWRKLGVADRTGASVEDRSRFLALAGLGLNAVFALLVLTSLAPRILLTPCE